MLHHRRNRTFLPAAWGLSRSSLCSEATDFHFENLIAAAEHPVLVDLEALFHPRLDERVEAKNADDAAFQALEYSVLRVGLLPQRIWTGPDSEGVDISGLGALLDK